MQIESYINNATFIIKMVKTKGKLTVIKKILNNKSRKGEYWYIKEGKNRPSYYKVKEGLDLDDYLNAYYGKIKAKKRGVIKVTKEFPAEKYLMKVRKHKKIDDLIVKGRSVTEVNNLNTINKAEIHQIYMNMLESQVSDKVLLSVLALEENVEKFKYRIQSIVKVVSEDGDVEIELNAFNKSLTQINSDFGRMRKKVNIDEEDLSTVMNKGYRMHGIPKGVDITGSKGHVVARKLGKISVKLIFVKGN